MDDWNKDNNPKQGIMISSELYKECERFQIMKEVHNYKNQNHEFKIVNATDWVSIVPVERNYFYMIWQYRSAWKRSSLEFPAGRINKDEEYKSAAIRELQEETGLIASNWKLIGSFHPVSWTTQLCKVYLASEFKLAKTNFDESEDILLVKIPILKFIEKVDKGDIIDMPTVTAYTSYINSMNSPAS